MSDLEIVKDRTGETMMVGVQGLTEEGIDFVEAFPTPALVVDADRIVVAEAELEGLIDAARRGGLSITAIGEDGASLRSEERRVGKGRGAGGERTSQDKKENGHA